MRLLKGVLLGFANLPDAFGIIGKPINGTHPQLGALPHWGVLQWIFDYRRQRTRHGFNIEIRYDDSTAARKSFLRPARAIESDNGQRAGHGLVDDTWERIIS